MKKSIFNTKIKVFAPKRNKFDLGHEKKLTLNMGELVPMYLEHVVPGDKFRVNSEIFMRFAPMIAPIMHRVDIYTHYFFVPYRLLWDEWERFISGGEDGTADPIFPQFNITQYATTNPRGVFGQGSLADYLGIPTLEPTAPFPTNIQKISGLPFRAYQTIFNEYYRDQNLTPKVDVSKTSGDFGADLTQVLNVTTLRRRAWEKDYFTSSLPWPQKGDNEAGAPVQFDPNAPALARSATTGGPLTSATGFTTNAQGELVATPSSIVASIDQPSSVLINELRKANKLQEWLEKTARGGSRYIEQIMSHFGVTSSDARLQRPEYLGGGKQRLNVSEVLSTFDNTGGDFPQGTMSGHGISSGRTHGFSRGFEEHGLILGIMSVLPKSAYQQGINKHWEKFDKFDHYWPSFANLGEQAVKGRELYFDYSATQGDGDEDFGYQSRYSEYKFGMDTVHGDFRGNLAYWHIGRIFGTKPLLNEAFITADNAEMDRIFAVVDPDEHKLWCQVYNSVDALRPMPYFGTPSL